MGIFEGLFGDKSDDDQKSGICDYGKNKTDGSHDHRSNRGGDRTPAQKEGDKQRRKD